MFGILNVNKPPGLTSRDVVNRVQRLAKPAKVGHAGTLDPLATGVLVVCVGAATRLVEYVQRLPKSYSAEFTFGLSSDTEDIEGNVLPQPGAAPSREAIAASLPQFVGRVEQLPPVYSALKVGGKRAYALARAGEEVVLQRRHIDIYSLKIVAYEYPRLWLDIECGSGVYIRSLGRDIAAAVNSSAVMSALQRTAIGPFVLENALALDAIRAEALPSQLAPAAGAVAALPRMVLEPSQLSGLGKGQRIEVAESVGEGQEPLAETVLEAAAFDRQGRLRAIIKRVAAGCWAPLKNFPHE